MSLWEGDVFASGRDGVIAIRNGLGENKKNRNILAECTGAMGHCLRKQQSRLVPAQAGIQAIGSFTPFWIPACAGMTLSGLPFSRE
jgi:hypothetical protein